MKYACTIVLLISSALLSGTARSYAQLAKRIDPRLWQEACSAAQQGKLDSALERFKTVLGKKPEVAAVMQAGALLSKQGGSRQAEEIYRWGRKKLGQPDAFADRLAELYQSQLKYQMAVEEWLKLLPKQPGLVRARLEEMGGQQGYGTVAGMAEAALKKNDDAGRLLVGSLYLKDRNHQRAWAAFGSARSVEALKAGLAQLLQSYGVPDQLLVAAIEEYRSRSGDRSPEMAVRLGDLHRRSRQFGRAAEAYRQLLPTDKPLATVLLGQTALERGDAAGLFQALGQAGTTSAWPDTLRAWALLLEARGRAMAGDLAAAQKTYSSIYSDSTISLPARQRALYERAEAELMDGQADLALADYRQVVRLGAGGEPSNDALLRIVLISEARAGTMNGLQLWARGLYARARLDRGQALAFFADAAKQCPGTSLADQSFLAMAEIQLEQGEPRQAIQSYQRLAEGTLDSTLACQALYREGMVVRDFMEKPTEAAEIWRQAIVKYPDYSWSDLMRQELATMK